MLDLGTGTGCLLLAFLHERPRAFGIGTDRSAAGRARSRGGTPAIWVSRPDRAFLCGDWASPVDGRFDLVLSNPPYIPSSDLATLMPEVARHEPRAALDGGLYGLTAYRAIVADLPRLLRPSGAAVLELGIGQHDRVAALATEAGFRVAARPDLSGTPRAMILRPSP